MWTIGFVTGTVENVLTKEKFLKVFLPTVPNPTTGFVVVVRESEAFDPGWTVDEGFAWLFPQGLWPRSHAERIISKVMENFY